MQLRHSFCNNFADGFLTGKLAADESVSESERQVQQETTRVEMLGGLRLKRVDQTVTRFATQKTAALLARLAFFAGKIHAREEKSWPGSCGRRRKKARGGRVCARRLLRCAVCWNRRASSPEAFLPPTA